MGLKMFVCDAWGILDGEHNKMQMSYEINYTLLSLDVLINEDIDVYVIWLIK